MAFASHVLLSGHVACIMVCKGVTPMFVVNMCVNVEAFMWRRGDGVDGVVRFSVDMGDLCEMLPANNLALEHGEVNDARVSWIWVCFIQCLCRGGHDVQEVIKYSPQPSVGKRWGAASPVFDCKPQG